MINFAIYLLEFVSVLLVIHIVFQSCFRMDIAAVVLFLVSMFTLFLAYFTKMQFITYLTQFAFYVYAMYEFRRSWWETLIRFACSIAIIAIVETIFRGQFVAAFPSSDYPLLIYFGISICMFICLSLLYWCFVHRCLNINIDIKDKAFIFLVVVINLFVLYVKDGGYSQIFRILICFVSFALLFGRFVMLTKKEKGGYKKNEEVWLSQYIKQYEELIQEVRRRQHDYKNEIQTIKMAYVTGGNEVALDVIKEYEDDEQYTNILNGCENPIIAGLIYSKVRDFKEQGVTTVCRIRMRNVGIALEKREVVDIIGILLDNAFECTKIQDDKVMQFEIDELEKGMTFKTSNPSPYISFDEISKMFTFGYSTKGENRGIGLHTVRNLVKKCHGDIITGNRTVDNHNYFDIQIIIPFSKT